MLTHLLYHRSPLPVRRLPLSLRTLIAGPNECGKTTAIEALRVALTIPRGHAFREVALETGDGQRLWLDRRTLTVDGLEVTPDQAQELLGSALLFDGEAALLSARGKDAADLLESLASPVWTVSDSLAARLDEWAPGWAGSLPEAIDSLGEDIASKARELRALPEAEGDAAAARQAVREAEATHREAMAALDGLRAQEADLRAVVERWEGDAPIRAAWGHEEFRAVLTDLGTQLAALTGWAQTIQAVSPHHAPPLAVIDTAKSLGDLLRRATSPTKEEEARKARSALWKLSTDSPTAAALQRAKAALRIAEDATAERAALRSQLAAEVETLKELRKDAQGRRADCVQEAVAELMGPARTFTEAVLGRPVEVVLGERGGHPTVDLTLGGQPFGELSRSTQAMVLRGLWLAMTAGQAGRCMLLDDAEALDAERWAAFGAAVPADVQVIATWACASRPGEVEGWDVVWLGGAE